MGMTLAFYSADANELVALFAAGADCDEQDEETFFAQLDTYPVADFSLHLSIPEDLDNLCQALREHNPLIPLIFRDVLVEQVWDDGPVLTESLTTLAEHFVKALAALPEQAMEDAARKWAATFPYREPPWQTPAYQALWSLQEVAHDAVTRKRSLLLHLAEHPAF